MDPKVMVLSGDLKVAELSVPLKGQARRDAPAGMVRKTGHSVLNAGGTDLLREVIRLSNVNSESVALTAAVNVESGVVALYVTDPGAPGSVVCRFLRPSRRAVFHLSGVFAAYPSLQVLDRTFCPVAVAKDSAEKPCLALALKGTYQVPRRSRTGRSSESPSAT